MFLSFCARSGVCDGLCEAPQPAPDCSVSQLGGGVFPAGAARRPPVARRCNERQQLWTPWDFHPAGAHCAHTARSACWPHHLTETPPQPAHHQRQHHLRPGLEGVLSHPGVAGVLSAGGQCYCWINTFFCSLVSLLSLVLVKRRNQPCSLRYCWLCLFFLTLH